MADEQASKSVDLLTVIAIAVIAYAALNVTHEIIGHCGMGLVIGTRCTFVSTTYIPLAQIPPAWKYNLIVVAGCAANFTVGLISFGLLRRRPEIRGQRSEIRKQTAGDNRHESRAPSYAPSPDLKLRSLTLPSPKGRGEKRQRERRTAGRFFLWLLMAVNLFLASTYIAVAPIIKFGDSYILIQNLPGQIFWRPAVALVGALAWWLSFRIAGIELARLIGAGGRAARPVALKLLAPAYLTGGILTVTSALFSQMAAKWAQLEAAGGTFGCTIWLLLLPFVIPKRAALDESPFRVPRSVGWILAGALTAVIFIGILGRGIAMGS